jgi:hypothetical protein
MNRDRALACKPSLCRLPTNRSRDIRSSSFLLTAVLRGRIGKRHRLVLAHPWEPAPSATEAVGFGGFGFILPRLSTGTKRVCTAAVAARARSRQLATNSNRAVGSRLVPARAVPVAWGACTLSDRGCADRRRSAARHPDSRRTRRYRRRVPGSAPHPIVGTARPSRQAQMPGDDPCARSGAPLRRSCARFATPADRSDFPALGTRWHAHRRRSSSSFPFLF